MHRLRLISDSAHRFRIHNCGDHVRPCGIPGGSEGIGVHKIYRRIRPSYNIRRKSSHHPIYIRLIQKDCQEKRPANSRKMVKGSLIMNAVRNTGHSTSIERKAGFFKYLIFAAEFFRNSNIRK